VSGIGGVCAFTIGTALHSRSKKIYLAQHVRGYRESQAVIETLTSNGQRRSRVLVFGNETPAFYFRREHIKSVGDDFGPARLKELIAEIQRGDCRPYLDRLHVSAIIIDPKVAARSPALYTKIPARIGTGPFCRIPLRQRLSSSVFEKGYGAVSALDASNARSDAAKAGASCRADLGSLPRLVRR